MSDHSAAEGRFQSFAGFWPHYLSQHRVAGDRVMHFLGTTWMFGCTVAALLLVPERMIPALLGMVLVGWYASKRVEANRPAFREMLLLYALALVGAPLLMSAGIFGAYFLAWCGHFGIEHNKPAAFRYPVWSFLSDFRVWGLMVSGRLWTGDTLGEQRVLGAGRLVAAVK